MKFTRRQAAALLVTPAVFHAATTLTATKAAASTASPEFLEAVQSAMLEYIDATGINGQHLIFDAVKGDYIKATFKRLHKNMTLVQETFYVSCADFEDEQGNLLDVDYMVADADGFWAVFQAVIHERDGEPRVSHMEDGNVIIPKDGCCASKGCCSAKGCCAAKSDCSAKGCAANDDCAPKGCCAAKN